MSVSASSSGSIHSLARGLDESHSEALALQEATATELFFMKKKEEKKERENIFHTEKKTKKNFGQNCA